MIAALQGPQLDLTDLTRELLQPEWQRRTITYDEFLRNQGLLLWAVTWFGMYKAIVVFSSQRQSHPMRGDVLAQADESYSHSFPRLLSSQTGTRILVVGITLVRTARRR